MRGKVSGWNHVLAKPTAQKIGEPITKKIALGRLTSRACPTGSEVKNLHTGDTGDSGLIPRSGRFPWSRAWQSTPVFLPGESHGQRSLGGYSPWGCKELDTTEAAEHSSNI